MEAASASAPWLLHAPPGLAIPTIPRGCRNGREWTSLPASLARKKPCVSRRRSWRLNYFVLLCGLGLLLVNVEYRTLRIQWESCPTSKAGRLLEHLRRRGAGVPLHTGPWAADRLRLADHRGSHRSAKDKVKFVCLKMIEFCKQGFWTVLPMYVALQLAHLRLSLLGVVPQCNRRS